MFPRPESRIRTTLRRSIDAAIDFATLGEYGLASAWEDPADGIPAAAGSGTATRARQDQRLTVRVGAPATAAGAGAATLAPRTAVLLKPASAAGRAARNHDRRDAGACAGQHLLSRALEPQLPRAARSRDGQAPREQRCASDAG
jgi:hypothetical protein